MHVRKYVDSSGGMWNLIISKMQYDAVTEGTTTRWQHSRTVWLCATLLVKHRVYTLTRETALEQEERRTTRDTTKGEMKDLFIGGACKDKSCGENVFSGDACKDKT